MNLIRLQSAIVAVLLVGWFEVARLRPDWLLILGIIAGVLLVGTMFVLFRGKIFDRTFVGFTVVPLLLIGSGGFFYIFLENDAVLRILSLSIALLTWFYLDNVYLFLHDVQSYQPFALQHISTYLLLTSTFFLMSGLYGLRVFLSTSLPLLVAAGTAWLLLTVALTFWTYKFPIREHRWHLIGSVAILSECFVTLFAFPTMIMVNGVILTVAWHVTTSLCRIDLQDSLRFKTVMRYSFIGGSMILVTLLAAQWT